MLCVTAETAHEISTGCAQVAASPMSSLAVWFCQAYTKASAAAQLSAEGSNTTVLSGEHVKSPLLLKPGSNSEFAQRLARRYNPHFSQPNTSPDQRAADVF